MDGRRPTSILVTAGIRDAVPLNEVWESTASSQIIDSQARRAMIDAVARLIAQAHQNGIEHFDLHSGNVLIQQRPAGYGAIFVDLHSIRVGRPVSDASVVRNLAQLNQWFRTRATLTDRLRFLHRYLYWRDHVQNDGSCARKLTSDRRQLLTMLDGAIVRHANTLYTKRDRRLMRTGRYFAEIKLSHGWHAHAFLRSKHPVTGSRASIMAFSPQQWKEWLRDPLHWVTPPDRAAIIKDSRSAMVCRGRLEMEGGQVLDVVCKRSLPRNFIKRVIYALKTSRPMQTWKRANALLNRQVLTARPLAVVEQRRWGLMLDSILITEYIEHARDLDTVITVYLRELSSERQRRVKQQIARSLVNIVRLMHERGFAHRDFKAPNIMVQWDPAKEECPRVLLVDLDGLRMVSWPLRRHKIQALARLNISLDHCKLISLTDRVRFLKQYLGGPGRPEPEWKSVWREIAIISERKRGVRARQQRRMFRKYGRF